MLRPDELAPLPGYARVIVCPPAAAPRLRALLAELGDDVAALVAVRPRACLAPGEGYTYQRPIGGPR